MLQQPQIFIIDDEPTARDTIEGLLYRENYDLIFAADVFDALDQLHHINPDVILMDVMMPGVDGFEACRRIKNDERWQHIPIILITALNSKEDLARGLDAGADEFLSKPVNGLELRARVRSMLRIKEQYDELTRLLHLREDMAGMVVHDMRVPLNAILGFSELLLIENNLTDQQRNDVENIHSQAHRLNTFVNDLLILAKAEQDKFILNRTQVNVNRLMEEVEQDHRLIAQSKKMTLAIKLPPYPTLMMLDKNLIRRVLDNLLANALKFSPANSTVTCRLTQRRTEQTKAWVRIEVSDEGPGIPPSYRDRIFNKFEIVTLKDHPIPQVGLGLAFCKMVIDAHDGHIWVEDNKPTGSVFVVEI
ncbi:MAG: hybrid sensor histidine kinase/response regulator [Anaerolineae bacterium]|nr:hybrid sensor histidine kinase/response regulator [Anaerolineae bacterium]